MSPNDEKRLDLSMRMVEGMARILSEATGRISDLETRLLRLSQIVEEQVLSAHALEAVSASTLAQIAKSSPSSQYEIEIMISRAEGMIDEFVGDEVTYYDIFTSRLDSIAILARELLQLTP